MSLLLSSPSTIDTLIDNALLALPVLNFTEASVSKQGIDFESLVNARKQYEADVKAFVSSSTSPALTTETVEACVDILLRYFNAANFVGDISLFISGSKNNVDNDSAAGHEVKLSEQGRKAREERVNNQASAAIASKLEAASPRVFKYFGCLDRQEMPPSAFTTSSKTGYVPNKDDVAEGASRVLPPEPYRLLLRSMLCDGEAMESAVRRASLLAICVGLAHTLPITSIWRLRVFFRYQLCLAHRSNTLNNLLMQTITEISNGDIPKSQAPGLALEFAHVFAYFHRPDGAQRFLNQAVETSGLVFEEQAFHGVRTRHMQHEVPQLALSATSAAVDVSSSKTVVTWEQPNAIQCESSGHDILDRPRKLGSNEQFDGAKPLLLRDYAIILALCSHLKQSTAEHGLTTHQARIYTERLMIEPEGTIPWAFRSMALLLRARFEYGHNRVQERAFLQYQELIDSVVPEGSARLVRAAFMGEGALDDCSNEHFLRLERCDPNAGMFYAVAWPSQWTLRREYGERCFEDNLFKTALELFELTLDWPNIIKCCKELDRRNKAASLAEDLLKEDPNDVMLWVALGEAKRDEEPLLHAWKLCKGLMAAPMRSLARLALSRERYDDVVKYFDQSVKINPVFGGDWFSLGFAAMRLKEQNRAGEAFTRVCQIDPEDCYAWANLAAILLRQGKPRPAFNATSQALRNNPNDWRMWDNYFKIGVEIREVSESAHALRRVMVSAGQKYHPEYESLSGFAKIAVQFIRGELEASANDDQTAEEKETDRQEKKDQHNISEENNNTVVVVSLDSVDGAEKLRVPAFPIGAIEDKDVESDSDSNDKIQVKKSINATRKPQQQQISDEAEDETSATAAANAGLQPLFSGIDDVSDSDFYKDPIKQKKEMDMKIRQRFEKRTRELLLEIGGTYTSHAPVHAALAEFFGALDGPVVEFVWRSKQVRETLQQPLWERTKEKLQTVVEAVTAMTKCAIEAEKLLKEQQEKSSSSSNNNNNTSVAGTTTTTTTPSTNSVAPKRDTLQQLNHILEKATPHFEDPDILRPVQVCVVKLKKI